MPSTEERFSAALHNTARSWRQALDRRLKGLGLSQAGWMAIAVIAKAKTSVSQTDLAGYLGVEGSTIVASVDRLVKAGLVNREPSPTDRRVKLVVLTEAGHALHGTVKQEAEVFRTQLLAPIGRDMIIAVTEVLEALQDAANATL